MNGLFIHCLVLCSLYILGAEFTDIPLSNVRKVSEMQSRFSLEVKFQYQVLNLGLMYFFHRLLPEDFLNQSRQFHIITCQWISDWMICSSEYNDIITN